MNLDTKRVQLIMMKKLMNKRQLANSAGVGYSTLYLIFSQKRHPNIDTVGKIANALGVEPSEIIKEEQE